MYYFNFADMINVENILASKPAYLNLLGKQQVEKLLTLFNEIENGKYNKEEIHSFKLSNLRHPLHLRAIRADMQSFVNTFIDPYFDKKAYLQEARNVIDAGANIGYTAILFANWWPQCKVISIEADTENYELTLKNTQVYPNIHVLHGGLWNKSTLLKIEAGQEDGFVVKEKSGFGENENKNNLTQGVSLTEIMDQFQISEIDFLKMNIEGSEKDVFSENTERWLPVTKSMLVELHDGKNAGCAKAVFNATAPYDFAVAETAPYGVLFVKENIYRPWYAQWYKEEIYTPNIDKSRFPEFYLDKEHQK